MNIRNMCTAIEEIILLRKWMSEHAAHARMVYCSETGERRGRGAEELQGDVRPFGGIDDARASAN